MLKQEQPEQADIQVENIKPDLSARVTPHELAAALAVIQKRKDAEAKHLAETITVSQAVQELGIDATPEEILAEVKAQRKAVFESANNSSTVALPRIKGKKRGFRFWAMCLGALITIGTFEAITQHHPPSDNASASAPIIETLVTVPDNHPVTCDTANLQRLIQSGNQKKIAVTDGLDVNNSPWTLIKSDGHVYVRGYLQSKMTQDALDLGPVTLYNAMGDANSDIGEPTEVVLRTDQSHWVSSSGSGLNLEVKLDKVKLDDKAYQDWDTNN